MQLAVLIVEDDVSTLSLLGALARRSGYDAVLCADGEKALEALGRRKFDAVILDLLLPRVNGFEVLRHLKCTAPEMLPRTIVVTAAAEATYRGCEELQRVQHIFRKPLDIDEFMAEVRSCLQGGKANRDHHLTQSVETAVDEPPAS
jgi:DNA-binding response OmpR family regulator